VETKPRPASNTRDCFRYLIGREVKGVLFDALPVNRRDPAAGTKTLILDNGEGLTVTSKGTYWIDAAEDVAQAIRAKKRELVQLSEELQRVLEAAGA
jgi:hypothetical protein